jgi:hypothetical protein
VNPRGAKIRHAIRRAGAHLVAKPLELAAADVGQVLAIGSRRGALVEEYRNLELASDAFAERASKDDAVFHRRSLEGNERNDVGRTHARMLAGVMIEIDALARDANTRERGVDRALDRNDERHDRPVVRLVRRDVEYGDAIDGGDGITNRRDDVGTTTFREVRNALDEFHSFR